MSDEPVIIVGAGLAGLSCAVRLQEAKRPFVLLEASEEVGGRVRTDACDGFLLDRGFQVLLTAYPEAARMLDYDALRLGRFEPGALIRYRGKFHRFADPWRRPRHLLSTAMAPVASLADKLRVARLRRRVSRGTLEQLYQRPEQTTIAHLRAEGFSDRIIERFFRPFLGGIFLDNTLVTSSRMFEFVFRMFAQGDAALPGAGMGAMPHQLRGRLPDDAVRTGARVEQVEPRSVTLAGGERLSGSQVVVACEGPAAAQLLGAPEPPPAQRVACLYYRADAAPVEEPILMLNGDGEGPINNLCVPSQVCPTYAPPGQSLISVTSLAEQPEEGAVRSQLADWFGSATTNWQLLRVYDIPYALPCQAPPALAPVEKPVEAPQGVLVCGDHRDTASIQGAMSSGRRAAEHLLAR